MNPPCARCQKTVYPTEKLNCLDKVWHKMCFKCDVCGMTLSMKSYKGYKKIPYCNAHYPSTTFTAVADTPENLRIAQNTKLQSQIAYHADFEKGKGQYTSVTDAPELLRLKKNQELVSSIKYHEDFEKMKGMKTTVADDPETLRLMKNMKQTSDLEYKGHRQYSADQETRRGLVDQNDAVHQMPPAPPASYSNDFKSPYSARSQPGMSTAYTQQGKEPNRGGQRVGSISDYDPMNDQWGSVTGQPYSAAQQFTETVAAPGQPRYQQQPEQQYRAPEPEPQPPPPSAGMVGKPMYKALYDYAAADEDEVSFMEGDVIINAEPIDEGWMTGTVQRSGQNGMLPSNYVERCN